MNEIKEKFALHDGNVDLIKQIKDELIIHLELLNIKSLKQEKIYLKFKGCTNLHLDKINMVDWGNSSATILKYEAFDNKLIFFLELTKYSKDEIIYHKINFNFFEVENIKQKKTL